MCQENVQFAVIDFASVNYLHASSVLPLDQLMSKILGTTTYSDIHHLRVERMQFL